MKHIGRRCHEQGEASWRWCGKKVKTVDGSTVSMPDTDANQGTETGTGNRNGDAARGTETGTQLNVIDK
jgi:hypothetical protein